MRNMIILVLSIAFFSVSSSYAQTQKDVKYIKGYLGGHCSVKFSPNSAGLKIPIFSALSCGEIPLYFFSKCVFAIRLFKKSIILLEGVLA